MKSLLNRFNDTLSTNISHITEKSVENFIELKQKLLIGLGYENELQNIFSNIKDKEFKKALVEILNLQQKIRELNTGGILLKILNDTEKEVKLLEEKQNKCS